MELLVVVAIVGLISSIMAVTFHDAKVQTRDSVRLEDVRQILGALESYQADYGIYPPNEHDFTNPTVPYYDRWDWSNMGSFIPALVSGKYVAKPPQDPLNYLGWYYVYVDAQNFSFVPNATGGLCQDGARAMIQFSTEKVVPKNYPECHWGLIPPAVPTYCVCLY